MRAQGFLINPSYIETMDVSLFSSCYPIQAFGHTKEGTVYSVHTK